MTDPRLLAEHTRVTGEIICTICCESKPREQMQPFKGKPGVVWDVCIECWPLAWKAEGDD